MIVQVTSAAITTNCEDVRDHARSAPADARETAAGARHLAGAAAALRDQERRLLADLPVARPDGATPRSYHELVRPVLGAAVAHFPPAVGAYPGSLLGGYD
ncbi:hypothetical protein [Pseudonocardia xishanensis]|uniref:hypothetical protein n=1 Tax=Pseudonocardia xishanensis TaxID=630995 RepID=UPI0031F0C7F0